MGEFVAKDTVLNGLSDIKKGLFVISNIPISQLEPWKDEITSITTEFKQIKKFIDDYQKGKKK